MEECFVQSDYSVGVSGRKVLASRSILMMALFYL